MTPTSRHILLIGNCGVGKTWVMANLITPEHYGKKWGLITWQHSPQSIVVGDYPGATFDGSDRLSMAVMRDVPRFVRHLCTVNYKGVTVWEGDRFMNQKLIDLTQPAIIKIEGSGFGGRARRNTNQTGRHIKTIATRVGNIARANRHATVAGSKECLAYVRGLIEQDVRAQSLPHGRGLTHG